MGADEIYLGQRQRFMTVVGNLETVEPLWMGPERKRRRWTCLDFWRTELPALIANLVILLTTSGV
jgi:hypothetical protein